MVRTNQTEKLDKDINPLSVPVEPVSLVSDIADRFRESLMTGSLKPGEEINESQLTSSLGVSRGTIREAIRVLVGEGVLEKPPNRTARVRRLTPEKAWEIMTARVAIEGLAARVLAERLNADKIQRLREIWEQLHAAAIAYDHAAFIDWDFALHQAIMKLSEHGVLYETWTKMSTWIRLMFASQVYEPEEMMANALNHKKIIDAIVSGDPNAAEAMLEADLLDQQELQLYADVPSPDQEPRSA